MKLLTLKITSEFRNLENLNLSFDPANDTYVIIGNNGTGKTNILAYIIHSGFISGYQNRYGDNLKPPTNVYHRMTA